MSHLLDPILLRRIAGEVSLRWPSSLGWAAVGLPGLDSTVVWTHIRPYLSDAGIPPGFRVEGAPLDSFEPCGDPRYVTLFARPRGGDFTPGVYELIGRAQEQSLPWLAMEVDDDTPLSLTIFEQNGSRKPLSGDVPPLRAREQRLRLTGSEVLEVSEYLPLEIQVMGEAPSAALSVDLLEHSGFSRNSYHFVIRGPEARPLGPGLLSVNVRCRPGKPDEVVLEASNFGSETAVEEWEARPRTEAEPRFHQGPVFLHLLFDRTTLDVDAWPVAFEYSMGSAEDQEAEEAYGAEQHEAGNWNHQLRQALAEALTRQVDSLHDAVQIYLWWFADTPKPGIASSRTLPWTTEPYGLVGVCPVEALPTQLSGSVFDYACGLDLFDAVDEALEEVAALIKERAGRNHEQHALLIVGDSPPPPSHPGDALWEKLVSRPVLTSARCSGNFLPALESLRHMQVPVAWLFMRTSRAPSVGAAYRKYVQQFQYFQSLRENVMSALQQLDGLIVEGCAGPEDLERAMGKILSSIARSRPRIPGVLINALRGVPRGAVV